MSSKWTHEVCNKCWAEEFSGLENREPVRLRSPDLEKCCKCGELNRSGIYVRSNSESMKCGGIHE